MKKKRYKVTETGNYYHCALEDEIGRKIYLDFYDIEEPQNIEYVYLSEIYFDKVANESLQHFNFGGLSEPYGRDIKEQDYDTSDEILAIERCGKKVYLKRFYG